MTLPESEEKPPILIPDPLEELKRKWDFQTTLIIGALLIGFISLLITVFMNVIEAWHFNAAVYKEYTEKMSATEDLRKAYQLQEEENRTLQTMLLQQQQDILKILEDLKMEN